MSQETQKFNPIMDFDSLVCYSSSEKIRSDLKVEKYDTEL